MADVFENPWLLLTLAAVAIIPAALVRQAKPRWGYWPLLAPLLLAVAGIGLDRAVQTDSEQIHAMIRTCRRAVIEENVPRLTQAVCESYNDGHHGNKEQLIAAAQDVLKGASVKKVRFQNITLNIDTVKATVEMDTAVHLNPNSRYASFGSLMFVSLRLELGKKNTGLWCIQKAGVTSINNQPMNWGYVR